jgi:hypothetical protein
MAAFSVGSVGRMGKLKCGLIQMGLKGDVSLGPTQIRDRMIEAHLASHR